MLTRMRTISDAATVTGRPYRTIQTWARTGRIPAERHGDRLLVDVVAAARLSEATGRRQRTSSHDASPGDTIRVTS